MKERQTRESEVDERKAKEKLVRKGQTNIKNMERKTGGKKRREVYCFGLLGDGTN